MGEFAIRPASPIARRQLARARVVVVALLLSPVVTSACKSGKQNVSEGKAIEQKGNVEVHAGDVTGERQPRKPTDRPTRSKARSSRPSARRKRQRTAR